MRKVKQGKVYSAYNFWIFQSIHSWLQDRVALAEGQPFMAGIRDKSKKAKNKQMNIKTKNWGKYSSFPPLHCKQLLAPGRGQHSQHQSQH